MPAVLYIHKDHEYRRTILDFYRRYKLRGQPFFSSDVSPAAALAKEGIPFVLITGHFPGTRYDALVMAQELKTLYGELLVGIYAHTVERIDELGALDGVIPKDVEIPLTDICYIIADLIAGKSKEELFVKYPSIIHH